jgi:hypothetical protein
MWGTSEAYRAALGSGFAVMGAAAQVLEAGAVAASLDVLAGSVTLDETGSVRRRCDLVVADPTGALLPTDVGSLLAPFGNELALFAGPRLASGASELVPVGVYRIEGTEVEPGVVALSGWDRSLPVSLGRLERPWVIRRGTNVGVAIRDLIASRSPLTEFRFASTLETTGDVVLDEQADPWEEATRMAEAIGMELFYDAAGVCVLRPVAEGSSGEVVATYADGEGGAVVRLVKRFGADPGHNVVVATGETTSNAAPVRAVAEDLNPSSPTYVHGKFGRRPRFASSQYVTTTAQARAMARGLLAKHGGGSEVVELDVLPDPSLEGGDVVRARRSAAKVDDLCVVSGFTFRLGHRGTMPVHTRRRRALEQAAA